MKKHILGWLVSFGALAVAITANAAITTDQVYLLNKKMGSVASKVQLGTLIQNAETVTAGEIPLTSARILVGNGSNVAAGVAMSGDATIDNAGAVTIANSAVTNAKVAAAAAIAFSKLAALPDGQILVGSAGTVPTAVAMSGDATIVNSGAVTIAASAVTAAKTHESLFREVTGTLSQAQLLAIGTPVTLVAAPGAGKVVIVDEIELFHDYAVAAYATGADVQIEYATSGDNIALVVDSFVTGGADQYAIIKPSTYDLDGSTGTGVGFDVTANVNKAVQVTGSNFTNGDATNVVKYRVRYHVVTLQT